jgi:hypothetical protein
MVPVAGSALTVVLETIFSPPLERRRERWLRTLAEAVEELQSRADRVTPESLASNEAFISVAMQATQIALRSHQEEKFQALRAAVVNAGSPDAPSDDHQSIYLKLVDELTPLHLRVLELYGKPADWLPPPDRPDDGWGWSVTSDAICDIVPEFIGENEFYEQVVRDLQVRGLINQGLLTHFRVVEGGLTETRTTKLGKGLLSYISRGAP